MATPTPAVKSPKHYEVTHGVEAMDVIEAVLKHLNLPAHQSYLLGNLLKYRLRAGNKDDLEQDIAKADEYKRRLDDIRKPKTPYDPYAAYAVNMAGLTSVQFNGMWGRHGIHDSLYVNSRS